MPPLTLVSHTLCPYVQRAAIVLAEKGAAFERRDIDLAHKPDWFVQLSPLGKTPVLVVGQTPLFESAVICEYLDETLAPRLHPPSALERARERGWMEFGSAVLNTIGAFYSAPDETALEARALELHARFARVEAALGHGPYFAGARFGMVDAVFGPVFRYFDVFDEIGEFGCLQGLPKTQGWRAALAARPSVLAAAHPQYAALLRTFLVERRSAFSRRMPAAPSEQTAVRNRLLSASNETEALPTRARHAPF
jgi:glutathione S-transferase